MPGGDRTGPAGLGPRTGRAAGYCSGNDVPGFTSAGRGRRGGFGGGWGRVYGLEYLRGNRWGMGRGRGWRWRAVAQPDVPMDSTQNPESATRSLEAKVERMREELAVLSNELKNLRSIETTGEEK